MKHLVAFVLLSTFALAQQESYEQYDDEAALQAHRAAPYFAQYVTNGFGPLMETVTRETFTTISSG